MLADNEVLPVGTLVRAKEDHVKVPEHGLLWVYIGKCADDDCYCCCGGSYHCRSLATGNNHGFNRFNLTRTGRGE